MSKSRAMRRASLTAQGKGIGRSFLSPGGLGGSGRGFYMPGTPGTPGTDMEEAQTEVGGISPGMT